MKNVGMLFPIMELDDQIILRDIVDDDASDYFNYMSKPEMVGFLTQANCPETLEQAKEDVRYWGGLFRSGRSIYWGIALRRNDRLIGTAGFNMVSFTHLKGEISYDLDYEYWGNGIMLRSIKRILQFADEVMLLVRIQATVIVDNARSIRVLERCGFDREGYFKKYEVVAGEHKDYYMYARVH